MNLADVKSLLENNKDQRGIDHWNRLGTKSMTSYGIGLTKLKKLAKQIGKDHELALELWNQDNMELKTLATIIDDPKLITADQVENQIADADFWILSHSYCSNLMSKLKFLKSKSIEWAASEDKLKKRCGYLCIYHLAKDDKKIEDGFFESYINIIKKSIQTEENFVKDAMNNALLRIGLRNKVLHEKALAAAKNIGTIEVDYGDNSCQAVDCVKHLTSERVLSSLN